MDSKDTMALSCSKYLWYEENTIEAKHPLHTYKEVDSFTLWIGNILDFDGIVSLFWLVNCCGIVIDSEKKRWRKKKRILLRPCFIRCWYYEYLHISENILKLDICTSLLDYDIGKGMQCPSTSTLNREMASSIYIFILIDV